MWRALAGVTLVVGLSACGDSPNSKELIVGTWLHDADAAHPEIPSSVTYHDDGTMIVVGEPTAGGTPSVIVPATAEGRWSIDNRNFLEMSVACVGRATCPVPAGAVVNYRVSTQSLAWIWGDHSEWHFHK